MSFFEYAKTLHVPFTNHLVTFLGQKKQSSAPFFYNDVIDKLIDFVPHGKLLRGIAVILAYEMNGKKVDTNILNVAAAMELAHSSLLIHDDIMDNDYVRRGKKTIFSQYVDSVQEKTHNPIFYGQSMGMAVGDIGFFLAFELLNKASHTSHQNLMEIFTQELQLVGPAQMYDFHYGQTNDEPTPAEIMNVYRFKTGRYTFSLPLKLGAMLADSDQDQIKQLELFGENLGIAFQIHDDYLGVFGLEEETGKPVGSDIRENKKTLLRTMLLAAVNDVEKKKLMTLYGNSSCSKEDMVYVLELHKQYRIVDQLKAEEQQYIQITKKIVEKLNIKQQYKDLLKDLITYTVERKK